MTTTAPQPVTAPRTFAALLERRLREHPGSPLVTFYDDATGERTELSVTSYANWVAKHANLLREELDLDDDATVLVDLPPHWLVPVVLGGAWLAGLAVTTDPDVPHDAVLTDVDGAPAHAARAAATGATVLACALHPFALPHPGPLPAGVLDLGHLWPGQSDVFVAGLPATGDEPAWRDAGSAATAVELLGAAAAHGEQTRDRLLTTQHPATDRGVPDLLVPLLAGSVVYVRRPDPAVATHRAEQERVTRTRPAGAQPPSV